MSDNSKTEKDIDWSKVEWKRGETPEDIDEKCFNICKEYLGGVWRKININEIVVKRVSAGLTNQLYYCAVDENKQINDVKEPQEVLIRLYGSKHFITGGEIKDQRLTDAIIALMLSENGLGPKVYGLFESGEIIKFYKQKSFREEEQQNPKLVRELAQKLARIHSLDVPIKKTGSSPTNTSNWVFDHYDSCLKLAKESFDLKQLFEETKSETLIKYDLEIEKEWFKSAILQQNCPIVFTLADFSPPNIMVTESDGIVVCDFDYSCYNFRGHDFGTLFAQWARVLGQPYQFPDNEIIKPFIDSYIEEMIKIKGKQFIEDKRNSFDQISKESKIFGLNAYLSITLWNLQMQESIVFGVPFDKKKSMIGVERNYKTYQKYKHKFIDEGIVQKVY